MEAAVEQTPVTTPETSSPAAPATGAPSPSSSTSQRPTSFEDAFKQVDAAAEAKAAADTLAAAATVQPPATDPNAVPDPNNPDAKQGPIPFTEHKKILENARVERDTARTELQQTQGKLSQLLQIPQAELADVVQAARQMGSDPVGHTFGMIKHLLADPTVGPQVRSELARAFGGLRGSNGAAAPPAQADQPMPQPDVQITDAQGNVVSMTYSAEQLAKRDEWRDRQWQAQVDQRIAPIEQERKAKAEQAKAEQTEREVNATVDKQIKRVERILGGRKDLYPQIHALMDKDRTLDAVDAAIELMETVVEPLKNESATRDALDTIHKKAAGNTAGNSGSATPLKRPTNADELAAYMRSLER